MVFDDSFQVDIREDLRIVSRTLKDITVPFDSLSGGTREQLSLIFRSACAMIIAKDGGAPLILDDTLGYTDSESLRLMCVVLYTATLIMIRDVIPAKAGIQKNPGFRVKPGMTNSTRLMSSCIAKAAKECQIVIFTYIPTRYGNVGEATVVALT